MILCLDVGNSQIFGGVFHQHEIVLRFRKTSKSGSSSDEIGLFLRQVLRENGVNPQEIQDISLCSVVPDVVHSLRNACRKYFNTNPFILQAGVKTGLKVTYHNPTEVGADRIANAIGATQLYPDQNMIIIDLGTATTFCAVTAFKEYLGGVITPGLRISMEALEIKTAKLPTVEIIKPNRTLGKSTVESIQSGLYFGHLGMMKEIVARLSEECFDGQRPLILGTGGFAGLFESENFFSSIQSDLVLMGLKIALHLNQHSRRAL
jgi:type III pantothenate kinase